MVALLLLFLNDVFQGYHEAAAVAHVVFFCRSAFSASDAFGGVVWFLFLRSFSEHWFPKKDGSLANRSYSL
jgi:hypothetical protein